MKFRLSDATKQALSNYSGPKLSKKQTAYYNSPEFYNRRPDLAPRDVYLRNGRKTNVEDVKKVINNFGKESFSEKCVRWINKFNNFIRCRKN